MSETPLFCPFCRECFEGERECPEHELALVPFDRLPRDRTAERPPGDDEALAVWEPGYGRGLVFAAALAMAIGFLVPLVHGHQGGESVSESAYEMAVLKAPNLWVIPSVAVGLAWVLLRRRTPRSLRSLRVAVPLMALLALTAVVYTLFRVHRTVAASGAPMQIELGAGVFLIAGAGALATVAAFRLGGPPTPATAPSDATAPDAPAAVVVDEAPPPARKKRKRRARR